MKIKKSIVIPEELFFKIEEKRGKEIPIKTFNEFVIEIIKKGLNEDSNNKRGS